MKKYQQPSMRVQIIIVIIILIVISIGECLSELSKEGSGVSAKPETYSCEGCQGLDDCDE